MSNRIPQATNTGTVDIRHCIRGYHPEIDRALTSDGKTIQRKTKYIMGNELPFPKVNAALYIDKLGWETVLLFEGGNCVLYDVLHKQVKRRFSPNQKVDQRCYNTCWVTNVLDGSGQLKKHLVVATNGWKKKAGFCCWDFDTSKQLPYAMYPNEVMGCTTMMERYQCHTVKGPLLLYGNNNMKKVLLFDIRDGESRLNWNLEWPLNAMAYTRPIKWLEDEKVLISEEGRLAGWDIEANMAKPVIQFPTFDTTVQAMDTIYDDDDLNCRQKITSALAAKMDGIYCSGNRLYIVDTRCRSSRRINLPLEIINVSAIACCGDSVLVGCTVKEDSKYYSYREKIIKVSLKQDLVMTSYTIPSCTNMGIETTISQVWEDDIHIIGLEPCGLHVFDQVDDGAADADDSNGSPCNRLCKVIGPWDAKEAKFHVRNGNVIITCKNNSPHWHGH